MPRVADVNRKGRGTRRAVEIDGSYGEGGGQMLRSALTMSALTGRPVRVTKIRAGRGTSGMAPQHLAGMLALARVCDADVDNAFVGSNEIRFRPASRPRAGTYEFDVGELSGRPSAGSVTLVFQTLLLPLAFAGGLSRLTLKGGTHVGWSPSSDYLQEVFIPTVSAAGVRTTCRLEAWGFYPAGGGRLYAEVEPTTSLRSLHLTERGELRRLWGRAAAGNLPDHIPERMSTRVRELLQGYGVPVDVPGRSVSSRGPGAGLFLNAEYDRSRAGFSAIGERGKPAERVAEEACEQFIKFHETGAPVDPRLSDQILLPLALADGRSAYRTSRLTNHLFTHAHVLRQFLPVDIHIERMEGEAGRVVVDGCGFAAVEPDESMEY